MDHIAGPQLMRVLSADDRELGLTEDFDAVITLYRPKVFRFLLSSLRDRDAAETLTQDCFIKAYKARDAFRNECSISTWLMQIAVNLVRDHARNRRIQFWKRTSQSAAPAEALLERAATSERSPEIQALLKEEVAGIWTAAGNLPEKQRTVFLLRFVEDMDLLEIAEATGLKEGTVKTHLFRALQSVREQVGGRG
jgi:RNA polymerase sigma-70 factor, ECF subfamily